MSGQTSSDEQNNGSFNTLSFPAERQKSSGNAEQSIISEVFDTMEQGVIVWSADGICEMVNARYYSMLNQGTDYLVVGMSRAIYFQRMVERGEADPEMIEEFEASLAKRQPVKFERRAAGGVEVALYIRPMPSGGHVVTFTDITRSNRDRQKLNKAIERAEVAEKNARESLVQVQERVFEAQGLSELSDWLQSCKSIDELYEIVKQAMAVLIPESSGQLFIYSNSRDVLDGAITWGQEDLVRSIQPHDCWALRRGRTFSYTGGIVRFPCNHVTKSMEEETPSYICLPIIAQGDTVGLLHITRDCTGKSNDSAELFSDLTVAFAQRCAEQISMAIANVKLRDELHDQSTRDPLTGLFNRRYFFERCRTALALAEREQEPFSLISFDADNFKSYNDRFGHEVGDYLLYTLGELTRKFFNENEDVCCRMGGEEFSILVQNTNAEIAKVRATEFLELIESEVFSYRDQVLPKVTVSAGVACFPDNATTLPELCRVADRAMYDAKDKGKNCVVGVD